jgi:carbon monoxide dehydrogenase subunit G
MPKITLTEQFAATPERAFAALTDFAALPGVISGIKKIELLTPGPAGLGTRIRETRTMYGREAVEEMQVTEWDPPRAYTLEARSHGAHYVTRHTFTARDGGTEVTLDFAATPQTFGAHIMAFMMRRMIKGVRSLLAKDLREAKAAAERRA